MITTKTVVISFLKKFLWTGREISREHLEKGKYLFYDVESARPKRARVVCHTVALRNQMCYVNMLTASVLIYR